MIYFRSHWRSLRPDIGIGPFSLPLRYRFPGRIRFFRARRRGRRQFLTNSSFVIRPSFVARKTTVLCHFPLVISKRSPTSPPPAEEAAAADRLQMRTRRKGRISQTPRPVRRTNRTCPRLCIVARNRALRTACITWARANSLVSTPLRTLIPLGPIRSAPNPPSGLYRCKPDGRGWISRGRSRPKQTTIEKSE